MLSLMLATPLAEAKTGKKTAPTKYEKTYEEPYSPPYAHILIDAKTGKILSKDNADQQLYPASLTKLMTLLMVFEALDARKITPRSSIILSSHATNMPPSKIGLKAGKSLTVEEAIKALVTKSANDVAVAIGEKLGGNERRFAQMMTLKAHKIGMTQTNFVNASGLHNPRQVSSARDMGRLALYILYTYPHYYRVFSIKDFYFNGKMHHNHNRLMDSYRGMDGMKTGYISQSGFNLVASAKRGNTRLIGVIFGGRTANSRNDQMEALLDRGFNNNHLFNEEQRIIQKNEPIISVLRPPEPVKKPENKSSGSLPAKTTYVFQSSPDTKQQKIQSYLTPPVSVAPSPAIGWSIQIGAFQDRKSTDQALYRALQKLPSPLNRGTALVIPLRLSEATWVFRARISGYTREQALQACRYLDDCLTISPGTN